MGPLLHRERSPAPPRSWWVQSMSPAASASWKMRAQLSGEPRGEWGQAGVRGCLHAPHPPFHVGPGPREQEGAAQTCF